MKFTIITTVLNGAKTVHDTVRSVKTAFKSYEHIIIDAGSTDGTFEFLEKVDGIILIKKQGIGIAEAWNFAIKKASGDFVGILNSDDFYSENFEMNLRNHLQIYPHSDIIIGDVSLVDQDLNELRYFKGHLPNRLNLLLGIPFLHPGVFVRRSFYIHSHGFNEKFNVAFDADWLLRAFKMGGIFTKHKSLTYMRDGGVSRRNHWIGYGEFLQSLEYNNFGKIYLLSNLFIRGFFKLLKVK
jgi:glycosyltransferase involved in cell wall biosynthesis